MTPRPLLLALLVAIGCGGEETYVPQPVGDTSGGGGLCSEVVQGGAATLEVTNYAGSTVRLLWVDYDCNEVDYGAIEDGKTVQQPTYIGHAWRVRDAMGDLLAEVQVDENPEVLEVQ